MGSFDEKKKTEIENLMLGHFEWFIYQQKYPEEQVLLQMETGRTIQETILKY
jgi:hypothetical protein